MSDKILIVLDSSAISNSACMLKLFRTVVQGYTSKVNPNDIEFGTAFHKFRKIFRDKGENGIAPGIYAAKDYFINTPMHVKSNKKYLTPNFLMKICMEYAVKYEKDQFQVIRVKYNKPFYKHSKEEMEKIQIKENRLIGMDELFEVEESLLELKFVFPYYVDEDMEILIAGTIDELGKHHNGIVCICDAKTTAMWNVQEYFEGFNLNCQLRFYKWSILKYIEAFPDSFLAQVCEHEIGCFVDGIFYKGADQEVIYQRSEVMLYNDDKGMKEMDSLVERKVEQLIDTVKQWKHNRLLPMREGILIGACETRYGKCTYAPVCAAVDDTVRDVMLDYNFVKKPYNPLNHGE